MPEPLASANFSFLAVRDAQLVRLGALAERYFKDDPATCLIKLRQYGETLAQIVAASAGVFRDSEEPRLTFSAASSSSASFPVKWAPYSQKTETD
jgi:hypothetical protein